MAALLNRCNVRFCRVCADPLVRRVGGLADTVVDATAISLADGSADGFAFDGDGPPALIAVVRRANSLFRERGIWLRMMRRAMTRDFSWAAAARRYVAVYRELRPGLVPPAGVAG